MAGNPLIRAVLGFSRKSDAYVQTRGRAVHAGMDGNPNFLNPPARLSDLGEALNNFETAMARALDGSRFSFAEKKKCRSIVERLLRQLGHYVEHESKGNMEIFLSSGFEATRTP